MYSMYNDDTSMIIRVYDRWWRDWWLTDEVWLCMTVYEYDGIDRVYG